MLSLAPNHALAQYLLGDVYIFTNRAAEGIAKCEHALALDRNLAAAHAMIGLAKYFTGRAEETESHVLEALRLSPRDTDAYIWMTDRRLRKAPSRPRRGSRRLAAPVYRCQSKSFPPRISFSPPPRRTLVG